MERKGESDKGGVRLRHRRRRCRFGGGGPLRPKRFIYGGVDMEDDTLRLREERGKRGEGEERMDGWRREGQKSREERRVREGR